RCFRSPIRWRISECAGRILALVGPSLAGKSAERPALGGFSSSNISFSLPSNPESKNNLGE
ncbi:unnamed protein product, partial [Sphenostylis stenocarpa]